MLSNKWWFQQCFLNCMWRPSPLMSLYFLSSMLLHKQPTFIFPLPAPTISVNFFSSFPTFQCPLFLCPFFRHPSSKDGVAMLLSTSSSYRWTSRILSSGIWCTCPSWCCWRRAYRMSNRGWVKTTALVSQSDQLMVRMCLRQRNWKMLMCLSLD